MFFENRFTGRAECVLKLAHECAAEMGHGYVGSEHILLGILREKDGRAARVLTSVGVVSGQVREKIREKTGFGNSAKHTAQGLTPCARKIVKTAFDEAKCAGLSFIGTEHLLLGILREESSAKKILQTLDIDIKTLRQILLSSGGGSEADYRNRGVDARQSKDKGDAKLLKTFGRDMCEMASVNKLDPVIGREKEVERMIRILARRTKNNPVLLGDPGVGKTAVVEGLAAKIATGKAPKPLAGKRIYMLEMSTMVAGTKYRGEFEERIKSLLREVSRTKDIILFIDEIHTVVGAGSAEGAIDAANILKPALSRREIQIIGATTFEEYRKHIERDAALARRFQPIEIKEPTEEDCFEMLVGLRKKYEKHHKIKINDSALRAAVELSVKYINDRKLPDKAIDLLDEAASKARICTASPPARMRELEEEIVGVVNIKEGYVKKQNFEEAANLRDREMSLREELRKVSENWQKVIEGKLEVDEETVAAIVGEQTGIPLSQITESESERLMKLESILSRYVVGQKEAVSAIARAIRRGRCGLADGSRPTGSFLFAGPTGVGKTALCRAIAKTLFGDEKKIIRMDMSEYMEKHEVSKIIGAPPGYIGHGENNTLIDKVRRAPYSVLLFDEIEKAHPDVSNLLLQILEDGVLTDSNGKQANFKNTVVVMTSNIGAERMNACAVGFSSGNQNEMSRLKKSVLADIKRSFRPELINRIDEIITFSKLSEENISEILEIMLEGLRGRAEKIGISLEVSDEAKKLIISRGYDEKYGARPLRREVQRSVEDLLVEVYLKNKQCGGEYKVHAKNGEIKVEPASEAKL